MNDRYSLDAFNKFLDYAADKGLMKRETALGRKRAANKILEILEPSETTDLRNIDVDEVSLRFANLQGTEYKPSSLQVYQSRLKSALADFFSYVENPVGFRPAINQRSSQRSTGSANNKDASSNSKKRAAPNPSQEEVAGAREELGASPGTIVFPIPIRHGLVVELRNIPADLKGAEADKIAAVVRALAAVEE
jgi:hypothetical protein